ncbi:MAG: transcription-repair coupling factor [Mariprofundaceae bacterium]
MQTSTPIVGLAYQLSIQARQPGLSVYICHDLRSYRQLAEELAFFLQDAPKLLWKFPAWEVLPYDRVSPHHAIVGERLTTASRLLSTPSPSGLLLTSLPAWLQRIAPPEAISAHVWSLKRGDSLDMVGLKEKLTMAGMQAVDRVLTQGEFAARGGLLDIWPATEHTPLRLDLFGDEIDAIRRFDPDTQRSGDSLDSFVSVPVREVILDESGRKRFAAAFLSRFPHLRKHPMLAAAKVGRPHPGIESLLPLAYEHSARLEDFLPDAVILLADAEIDAERNRFADQVRGQFDMVRRSQEPVVAPQELYAVETPIKAGGITVDASITIPLQLADFQADSRPLHAMLDNLASHVSDEGKILLVGHGPGQLERMSESVSSICADIPNCQGMHDMGGGPVHACIGFLDAGLHLNGEKLLILSGRELLGQRLPRRRSRGASAMRADVFASLRELHVHDPVVHEDHGVGRYLGLVTLGEGDDQSDFLHIEYASETSIYLPVEELDRLHRYTGEAAPQLNKLGSERWKRTRERAKRDILAMAHDIIAVDAERRQHRKTPYVLQGKLRDAYEEFAARFPFEETDDQIEAIDAILENLASDEPMDRVICGDVGFGKTEVALRAAFIVARGGRQVAVLAPTTVLANQHLSTFSERFAGTGLKIAGISRLQGKAEVERIRSSLESGDIDIIVGTHRLLSADIRFSDLGMAIVDEEQRFGVKHKDRLKSLHAGADLLTLTATPIPRTLHQTLSGLRSVSIISTPPAEREAIRTMVSTFDEHLATEAIRRELYRGGQIYYVHNHVQSIGRIAKRLSETVPEAEIGIAHGQMSAAELDRAMVAFYEGRLHILVCTTIIESGLDVPNANTLIVERADLLGLAQLHQIRGRVGRSRHQAYAYLFTPEPASMTNDARERLQAVAEHSELGAGFWLARQDMEIRGAGNLLGAEQSGHIEAIGLDLYLDMLSAAVNEAKGEAVAPVQALDMHLGVSAMLPDDYIPQIGERLQLYRRLAKTESDAEIDQLFEEMTDRFGRMPEPARFGLDSARIRWRARAMRLSKLDASANGLRLVFTEDSPLDTAKLLARVQQSPSRFRLRPDGGLSLIETLDEPLTRLRCAIDFLDELRNDCSVSQKTTRESAPHAH